MLTAAEVEAMRGVQAEALPDVCQVQRKTAVSDGMGGATETWAAVETVACRVAPTGHLPQERAIADRMTGVSTWTLTLPAGADVSSADRLSVGGRVFEVAAVIARTYETARRVVCVEVV